MALGEDENGGVDISTPAHNTLPEPLFLIKVGDVYYATPCVWEYNPDNATTDEAREGCNLIAAYFSQNEGDIVGQAILLKPGNPVTTTSTTNPPAPEYPKPGEPAPEPGPKDPPPTKEG